MKKGILTILMFVISVGLVLAATADTSAQGVTKIAFASNRDGNDEIYVMNPDGTNQINLTNNAADDYQQQFSPDGGKIVFASRRDGRFQIYVMNPDGTNQTRLTNNSAEDFSPTFSPDGTKIVYFALRETSRHSIYVMNADGTNQILLTDAQLNITSPLWGRQADNDRDGIGDACDPDDDNDGVPDVDDEFPYDSTESVDTDGDGIGNNADPDDDNDSVPDAADNCALTFNPDQTDFDLDGIGDVCDSQTGPPVDKELCKNGGWMRFDNPVFRNQGECIRYVELNSP
jgi:dipeptidyl aminopeptidase/acylaminoacyl peptidase